MSKHLFLVPLILLAVCAAGFASSCQEEFHARASLERSGALSLYNVTGRVVIASWDNDYVDIVAVKRTNGRPSEFKQVEIEIVQGMDVVVRTVYRTKNTRVSVDYEVRIPAWVRLKQIENVTGEVRIGGAAECREVRMVTGDLTVQCDEGPVRAECVTGGIRIHLAKLGGDALYKTITGSVDAYLPPDLDAMLDISVVTGSINYDGIGILLSGSGRVTSKQLKGTMGAGGNRIRMEVVAGSVNLHAAQSR